VIDAGGDLDRLLSPVNQARRAGLLVPSTDAEQRAESRFAASRRLAIYGSLAPGEVNHHHLASLRGAWERGTVRGRRHERGWGAGKGFPGLELDPGGEEVPVQLFVSDDLPGAWARLDAFEGDDYRRVLVAVHREGAPIAVANIYELRHVSRRR
jgi:gamma-glutamylcyclotransferase (GGCT)/AIG2-like uncharacterized protein YtfP